MIDRVRREPLFLAGAVAVALGGLVLAVGSHPAAFVLGLVLVGGGFAVWMIPAMVLSDRAGTPLPPAPLAVYRISLDAGMILGPSSSAASPSSPASAVVVGAPGWSWSPARAALARR